MKYLSFTRLDCKDIKIRTSEFVCKNSIPFLKAKAKNKFLNKNVLSTIKKCKRGISEVNSRELRYCQVDKVLKIDATFQSSQNLCLKRVNNSYRQYLVQRNEEFLGFFYNKRLALEHSVVI